MKRFAVLGIILAVSITAFSQEREVRTLVDMRELRFSGMGGPFMQFTVVDGEFAHMLGGGGALMLSNFWVGGYGLGTTNHIPINDTRYLPDRSDAYLSLSHGGFWLGYSLFSDRAIHVSISSLIGWGSLSVQNENWEENSDPIFAVVPTLEVEFNLTKFFRISAGASYNLYAFVDLQELPVGGVSSDRPGYTWSDISAPGAFLAFKFGWFY